MLILGVLLVVLVHVSPKKSPQIGEHDLEPPANKNVWTVPVVIR
jgi:hypothetical protein